MHAQTVDVAASSSSGYANLHEMLQDFKVYLHKEHHLTKSTIQQYGTAISTLLHEIDFPSEDAFVILADPQLLAYARTGFEQLPSGHMQSAWMKFRLFVNDPTLPEMASGDSRLRLVHPLAYDVDTIHDDRRWYMGLPENLTWGEFMAGSSRRQQIAATRIARFFSEAPLTEVDADERVLPLLPGTKTRLPRWIFESIRRGRIASATSPPHIARRLQQSITRHLADKGAPVETSMALYRTCALAWERLRKRGAHDIFDQWEVDFMAAIDRGDWKQFYGLLEKFTGVNPHSAALESILF